VFIGGVVWPGRVQLVHRQYYWPEVVLFVLFGVPVAITVVAVLLVAGAVWLLVKLVQLLRRPRRADSQGDEEQDSLLSHHFPSSGRW